MAIVTDEDVATTIYIVEVAIHNEDKEGIFLVEEECLENIIDGDEKTRVVMKDEKMNITVNGEKEKNAVVKEEVKFIIFCDGIHFH